MARQIVILCDVCLDHLDEHVEGKDTPPITIGSMKPRILTLCDKHWDEFERFKTMVQDLGLVAEEVTPTKTPGRRRGPNDGTSPGSGVWPCPDPECDKHRVPFQHIQSLRSHAKAAHGVTFKELHRLHGVEPPSDPRPSGAARMEAERRGESVDLFHDEADQPPVEEYRCEECGKVYAWPEYKRPSQALGVHKAKVHGIRSPKAVGE
jgi:hypothetical protein